MRKLIVLVVMSLYGLGNILFPDVDMMCLREMYKHCEIEDHDMNAVDFVFGHLLNIPDIFESFEKDDDEKTHQPIHLVNAYQNPIVLGKPLLFECRNVLFSDCAITYATFVNRQFLTGFSARILRPPIV